MIWVVYIVWGILQILITALACLFIILIYKFVGEQLQRYYYRWKERRFVRRCEKAYEIRIQKQRERELRKKEREKYPLFFWKENI